jgi:hypothetical protein
MLQYCSITNDFIINTKVQVRQCVMLLVLLLEQLFGLFMSLLCRFARTSPSDIYLSELSSRAAS